VERSREKPGGEKRAHLAEAVDRGRAALEAMDRARETEEMRAALARIEPAARISHTAARVHAREWGDRLRECAETLRIEASPPFPPEREPCDALEILIGAPGAAEFLAKIRERCGEDGLDTFVFYSQALRRSLRAGEVEGMAPDRFAAIRDEARKAVEDGKRFAEARKKDEKPLPEVWEVKEWGAKLRKADPDTLAKALVLRGTVVEGILPGGSPIDLEPGDLILDYETVYDLVMGASFGSARRTLSIRSESGGSLPVIREGRLQMISVPKIKP